MLLKNKVEIETWLKKHNVFNYELIEDEKYGYIVNVNGDVNLSGQELKKINIKFNIVEGSFNCSHNKLTSLIGCPEIVNDNFDCSNNKLETLEGCPRFVKGDFSCSNNQLETLIGCPEIVRGSFYCSNNKLNSLKYCPKIINLGFYCSDNDLISLEGGPEIINGDFYCHNNKLTSLIDCPKIINGDFYCNNNLLTVKSLNKLLNLEIKNNFINLFNNEALGALQNIQDFNEIKKILTIYQEKADLMKVVEVTDKSLERTYQSVENLDCLINKNNYTAIQKMKNNKI